MKRTCSVTEIDITERDASALRDLRLLDSDTEHVAFAMRADGARILLMATDDELDQLIGLVAAGANHKNEPAVSETPRQRVRCTGRRASGGRLAPMVVVAASVSASASG